MLISLMKQVLQIERVSEKIRLEQLPGDRGNRDERDKIWRYGPHPTPDEKNSEVRPPFTLHAAYDLRRQHKAAEHEEDLDRNDGDHLRRRMLGRIQNEIVGKRDGEGRQTPQQVE